MGASLQGADNGEARPAWLFTYRAAVLSAVQAGLLTLVYWERWNTSENLYL